MRGNRWSCYSYLHPEFSNVLVKFADLAFIGVVPRRERDQSAVALDYARRDTYGWNAVTEENLAAWFNFKAVGIEYR